MGGYWSATTTHRCDEVAFASPRGVTYLASVDDGVLRPSHEKLLSSMRMAVEDYAAFSDEQRARKRRVLGNLPRFAVYGLETLRRRKTLVPGGFIGLTIDALVRGRVEHVTLEFTQREAPAELIHHLESLARRVDAAHEDQPQQEAPRHEGKLHGQPVRQAGGPAEAVGPGRVEPQVDEGRPQVQRHGRDGQQDGGADRGEHEVEVTSRASLADVLRARLAPPPPTPKSTTTKRKKKR